MLVDTGGFTGAQEATAEARSLFLLEMMRGAGYDAVHLGVEDLRLGGDLVRSLVDEEAAPFVSANLRDLDSGRLVAPETRLIERSGVRIGITGVSAPSEELASLLADARMKLEDPEKALERVLPGLVRETDLRILIARMPSPRARELGERFAGQLDVIVLGNSERALGHSLRAHGGAVYVGAGDRGQAMGVARVALAGRSVEGITADQIVLGESVPENPEVLALLDTFRQTLADLLTVHAVAEARERGSVDGHYYLGVKTCASCHAEEHASWLETPHAHAFRTLQEVGAEKRQECVRCHVTGGGEPGGYDPRAEDADRLVDVQCEVCHGTGTRHARDGSYGVSEDPEACRRCHDGENSPEFEPEWYWHRIEHRGSGSD